MNCDCGGGRYDRCASRYTCLKIYVQYDLPNNDTVYAQMFESEFELRGNEVRIRTGQINLHLMIFSTSKIWNIF